MASWRYPHSGSAVPLHVFGVSLFFSKKTQFPTFGLYGEDSMLPPSVATMQTVFVSKPGASMVCLWVHVDDGGCVAESVRPSCRVSPSSSTFWNTGGYHYFGAKLSLVSCPCSSVRSLRVVGHIKHVLNAEGVSSVLIYTVEREFYAWVNVWPFEIIWCPSVATEDSRVILRN